MRISKWLGIAVSIAIPLCVSNSQELVSTVVPQGLWAAQVGPMVLRFAWNPVPGAAAYRISCGQGGKPERLLGTIRSLDVATYASGVPRRATYAMPINQKDGPGEYRCFLEWSTMTGRLSAKTPFNPVTTVSSANKVRPPAYATATSAGENEIILTWAPVPGATAYTINREVAPSGFSVFCDMCSTASTTIVDRFLEKSKKHRYFVTPIGPGGAVMRATSNYVVPGVPPDTTPVAQVPPGTIIPPPASVTATITGPISAKVSWIAIRGPVAYEITRNIEGAPGTRKTRRFRVQNDLAGVLIEVPDNLIAETRGGGARITVSYSVSSLGGTFGHPKEPTASSTTTSNTISVSEKDAQAIIQASRNVTDARATATSASSVMLTWKPPSGMHLCELERSLSGRPFGLLSRVPIGAYRYMDEIPDLMAKAPRYRIKCGGAKPPPVPVVAFPNPTPPG